MTDFVDVWEEAGYSVDAEVAMRALANAKAESMTVWPFLAMARDEAEFGQRLDLAGDTLTAAASAHEVPVEELVAVYTREYGLLAEARKEAAAAKCTNCGHANAKHCDGAQCQCGCTDFSGPKTAGKVPDSFKEHQFKKKDDDGDDDEDDSDLDEEGWNPKSEQTAYERYGENAARDYYGKDPGDETQDFYDKFSSLKTALEEGVDPLTWVAAEGSGQGTPEKPVEAGIEAAGTQVPADTQPPKVGGLFTKEQAPPTAAPASDPLAGRSTCPNGHRETKSMNDGSGRHKCFTCDSLFTPPLVVASRHPFLQAR
jgi:hypothetical protein